MIIGTKAVNTFISSVEGMVKKDLVPTLIEGSFDISIVGKFLKRRKDLLVILTNVKRGYF